MAVLYQRSIDPGQRASVVAARDVVALILRALGTTPNGPRSEAVEGPRQLQRHRRALQRQLEVGGMSRR